MSIQSEITRLQGIRTRQKTKLTELGIGDNPSTLEAITTALETIEKQGSIGNDIDTVAEQVEIPAGYHDGTGRVQIAAEEQKKIIATNIKNGITILGVLGTYGGDDAKTQEKSATPTKSQQVVKPDRGYDYLTQVTVEAIPEDYADITGTTATAENVLANKTFVTAEGELTAGTMANQGAVSATIDGLTTESYTIPEGYHTGAGTVSLTDDIETALAAL